MKNKLTSRMGVVAAGILITGLVLAGCASNQSRYGKVYREWSSRMSEMGIFPVYPPREDIVVGDVYALPLHPYDRSAIGYIGGLGSAGIHVSYLGDSRMGWENLSPKLFEDYYGSRPYPADVTNGVAVDTNTLSLVPIAGYADATSRTNAFGFGSNARMRQVAFPDFSATTIDQDSLSAVVPIEAIMTAFSFNYNDIQAVHIKIPQAESYGLTTEELLREVYEGGQFKTDPDTGNIYLRGNIAMVTNVVAITNVTLTPNGTLATNITFTPTPMVDIANSAILNLGGARMASAMFAGIMKTFSEDPTTRIPWYHFALRSHLQESLKEMHNHIYLALISEVYYARAMDITVDRKTATGATAAARPLSADELKKLEDLGLAKGTKSTTTSVTNTATSAGTNVITGTTTQQIDLSPGDDAFQLAAKMRQLNLPTGVDNTGGSVNVLRVSASNIGLRRTFQRPIAVGVRGVLIRLSLNPADLKDFGDGLGKTWMKVELDPWAS